MRRTLPALLCLLAACVPSKRREVDSPSRIGSGEVLVLGRIALTPPLGDGDQKLSWVTSSWRGKVMVVIGDEPTPIARPFDISEYSGRIEAPADREFSVALPRRAFAIRGCVVPLDVSGGPTDEALLPGGYRVDIHPDDVAVYIGTLHYLHDEFWKVTKVEVEDDYDRVLSDCRKQWGNSIVPRKALAAPAGIDSRGREVVIPKK
jgi:hypothetical protein